jgi:hypothetical protein
VRAYLGEAGFEIVRLKGLVHRFRETHHMWRIPFFRCGF